MSDRCICAGFYKPAHCPIHGRQSEYWVNYLDDLKLVYHHLKHSCVGIKSPSLALKVISDKSGLPVARVKEILRHES